MTRASPLISSFSGGELSPLLASRPELEKYQAGLQLCENAIPLVQGALQRRGGTRFVGATKTPANRTWLVEFIYSVADAFVLEFGDAYVRFYQGRGVFEASPGVPLEIVSPYALADLTDADGSFALRYEQSGDVIYFTHAGGDYPPYKLTRTTNTSWAFTQLEPAGGPFKDQNDNQGLTVYASGTTGSVTLISSSNIFAPSMVGGLFYIEMKDGCDIKPWVQRTPSDTGVTVTSDGKFYLSTTKLGASPVVMGDMKPTHTVGRVWDGIGSLIDGSYTGLEWEYLHSGYGWVKLTGYTDPTTVTATVISALPEQVVGSGFATWRWAYGAWSDFEGWPDNVTIFRERLTFWKARDGFCSVAGDLENFRSKDFGLTDASSAVRLSVQSGRGDKVKWLSSGKQLLAGTGGGEVAIGEQTPNQVFGPGNTQAAPQEEWGSNGVAPVRIGSKVLFVEKSGRAVRELGFSVEEDAYRSDDATDYAEHLFTSNIVDMAYARKPHSVIWCVRADGMLLGLTYSQKQGVLGWHRHTIGGEGIVESIAVIPTPDGARDELWMIVRRGARRDVEFLSPEYQASDDRTLTGSSDSHLLYSGSPTTTITGLGHLEGKAVEVMADGAAHPERTVASGSITLARSASKVVVGLAAPMRGRIMPLEAGAQMGTAQGKKKRVHKLVLRLLNSLGGEFGRDLATLDPLEYRTPAMAMDAAPPLFSGLKEIAYNGDYDAEATVAWEVSGPFPFTLVSLMPEMATYEN